VDQVLKALAKKYGLKVEDLMKGKRGKDNEPRKVGMYLVKKLCDLKLKEIAERFGTGTYGAVGWACHGVTSRTQADAKFRDRVGSSNEFPNKDLTPLFLFCFSLCVPNREICYLVLTFAVTGRDR
jgi:hypothetical protein